MCSAFHCFQNAVTHLIDLSHGLDFHIRKLLASHNVLNILYYMTICLIYFVCTHNSTLIACHFPLDWELLEDKE